MLSITNSISKPLMMPLPCSQDHPGYSHGLHRLLNNSAWLAQITEQQRTTVRQIGKMNKWHMALHQLLCDISILIQASNPAPIITLLNTSTCDVDHFAAALYNIDGQLTTLADNLQRLENAIDGEYDRFQEMWLQELQVLITRVEHTVVKHMLVMSASQHNPRSLRG